MAIDNNGPESPYPGPAEPGSGEETYPDVGADDGDEKGSGAAQGDQGDDLEIPANPPVDEDEEPSPGSSA